jgi:hypothetical protein
MQKPGETHNGKLNSDTGSVQDDDAWRDLERLDLRW